MSQICIEGFYGKGNLGDEVILQGILKLIGEYTTSKPIIFCPSPKQAREIHRVTCINNQKRTTIPKRLVNLTRSQLFLLGGGGLLKDYGDSSYNIQKWLKHLRWAQFLRKKTALCAVGVENIRYSQSIKLLRETLSQTDLITVRDNISREILQNKIKLEKKIHLMPDPALLIPMTEGLARNLNTPPKVIYSVRHWFSKGHFIEDKKAFTHILNILAKSVDYLIEQYGAEIHFIPLRTAINDNDVKISQEVISRTKNQGRINLAKRTPNIDSFIQQLRTSDLVIGMRLHSLILSAGVGTPMIALEYMPKVEGFMEIISQEKFSLDMKNLTEADLHKLIDDTISQFTRRTEHLEKKIPELKIQIRTSFKKITQLVDS